MSLTIAIVDFAPHIKQPTQFGMAPDSRGSRRSSEIMIVERMLPEIPRQLITVQGEIGCGFYGLVYQGILSNPSGTEQTTVALKSDYPTSEERITLIDSAALIQEATVMCGLNHQNILKLIGVVTLGQPTFIVLEFCEHGELLRLLRTSDHPQEALLNFARDCASGMSYLSSVGIVHRDLASRNVLVDGSMCCKISDYGMSHALKDKTFTQILGAIMAVRWTAPEALEQQYFSEQTDVWSFGVLLYEIWTKGERPYVDMTDRKVWIEVVGGYRLVQPTACPEDVFNVMQDCWKPNGERPSFSQLLKRITELIHRKTHRTLSPKFADV